MLYCLQSASGTSHSCVIYPPTLCDTLLRVAEANLYQIYFSQEILNGATRNLIKNGRFDAAKASRFQASVIKAFPEAIVEVPDGLAAAMTNDPGDRHVLAAAVHCQASVIVTCNLKHFRTEALAPWSIEAQHPDAFLCELCDLHGIERLTKIIQQQAVDRNRPKTTVLELLNTLEKQVPDFVCQVTTLLYGEVVEDMARKSLRKVSKSGSGELSGQIYDLSLKDRSLIIAAKDGRGEILRVQSGTRRGRLSPKDINHFLKIREAVDSV